METRKDDSIFHFLFRGLSEPVYGNPGTCAVMFEILGWETEGKT